MIKILTTFPIIPVISVSSNMNDWMEHQRISKEIENLKAETLTEEEEVHIVRQRNEEDKEKIQSLKDKHTDLQELCGCTRHLRDDVGKWRCYEWILRFILKSIDHKIDSSFNL
jgi:hypothetical protein